MLILPPTCFTPCRIYILAQLLAALLACSIFAFVSGWGPLMPLTSVKQLGLNYIEAMWMWGTGSPPKRLQDQGIENVTDLLEENKLTRKASKLLSKLGGRSQTDKVAAADV
jgi:hypothetical protein